MGDDGGLPIEGGDYAFTPHPAPSDLVRAGGSGGRPRQSLWDRFWPKVDASGDCWIWTGGTNGRYGMVRPGGLRNQRPAHAVSWELLVGPIPLGLQIDHLCKNTLCVNPDHLEPVTAQVNLMRSRAWSAVNARKMRCPGEHEYTPENTRLYRGRRHCRACERARLANRRKVGVR